MFQRLMTLVLLLNGIACEDPVEERDPDFHISAGVETVTVLDAEPAVPLTLYAPDGTPLVTTVTDSLGQAHFAYIPAEHVVLDPSNLQGVSLANGSVLQPGAGYFIEDTTSTPPKWSGTFSVRAVGDVPKQDFYDKQDLEGVHYSPLSDFDGDPEDGYQYIEMRDGVLLGAMVRFPDTFLYGNGPYPTVVEYSGYAPSRPDRLSPGSQIANGLGFATVSVNMRGTGCSGGVFDVFNRAQHADGYDVVEIVAAQSWAMHHRVGMIGLSYPGISQLYVASTQPPSLAAIVPLSVIADAWEMQWPGGIYNKGFTRQWVNQREEQSQAGGSSWVSDRLLEGDDVCEDNLRLSAHSVDFETFLRALDVRPKDADDRDLNKLVEQITAPVFLAGAFQDEQTGALFGSMLDRFESSRALKVILTNGRHPDGYAPHSLYRWFEFLEFYLSGRTPVLNPLVRAAGSNAFGNPFGMDETVFEEDRFAEYSDYASALAAYEAEPTVRLLFESGTGGEEPGIPVTAFETTLDSWPAKEADPVSWYFGPQGDALDTSPTDAGAHTWSFDSTAGDKSFFGPSGYQLLTPLWDIDWTRFPQGAIAAYTTAPFDTSTVITGPGFADLWVRSPVDDVTVQVTLSEVRSDNVEVLIQSGWLRLGHRAATLGENLRLNRTYTQEDFSPVPVDQWTLARVAIPSVAHPIRAGSSLRVSVSSPGRNHGTWEFDNPDYSDEPLFELGYGGEHASSLTMATLPGVEIPPELPHCESLRGQPCRPSELVVNTSSTQEP